MKTKRACRSLMNQKGIALAEVYIAMILISIMAVIASTLVMNMTKMWRVSQARLETQRDTRNLLHLIERRVRLASSRSVVLSRETNTDPPYSKIRFTMDPTSEIYQFYQEGEEAKMSRYSGVGSTKTITLAGDLKLLSFSYGDISNDKLLNVAVCFAKATYAQETKDFYMTLHKVQIQND